jgi:hypothetical protein
LFPLWKVLGLLYGEDYQLTTSNWMIAEGVQFGELNVWVYCKILMTVSEK